MLIKIYTKDSWKKLEYKDVQNRYFISIYGDIYDTLKEKYIKPFKSEKGYMIVCVECEKIKRVFKLHRLVAFNFITEDIFNGMTVNDINGDKSDNSIYNLEVVTREENIQHAFRTGLNVPLRGQDNPSAKLTDEIVREICQYIKEGKTINQYRDIIYNKYGKTITRYQVHDIKRRKTWKHISCEYFTE